MFDALDESLMERNQFTDGHLVGGRNIPISDRCAGSTTEIDRLRGVLAPTVVRLSCHQRHNNDRDREQVEQQVKEAAELWFLTQFHQRAAVARRRRPFFNPAVTKARFVVTISPNNGESQEAQQPKVRSLLLVSPFGK